MWAGLPLGVVAAAAAGAALYRLTNDLAASEFLPLLALLLGLLARLLFRGWSYLASLLMASVTLAGVFYLIYSVLAATADPLGPIAWLGTVGLFVAEVVAFGLTLSYAVEVLDVLSRRRARPTRVQPLHL